jgi:hypothetical protein
MKTIELITARGLFHPKVSRVNKRGAVTALWRVSTQQIWQKESYLLPLARMNTSADLPEIAGASINSAKNGLLRAPSRPIQTAP